MNHAEMAKINKKSTASSKIAEAVSVIAETCKSRNDAVIDPSVAEVIVKLQTLDEVANYIVFHTKCCQLMMSKTARSIFISLRGVEEKRMHWLKAATNSPLPFGTM